MKTRVIFHVDMDAFFASIEIALNPALKDKPVIVGGNPDRRGVVSTCSYEARKFGVRSAMSLSEAKRRCPHGIFLEGSYSQYRVYSDKIMEIFRRLTPIVEVVSIDEAYLDVTSVMEKYPDPKTLAELLKKVVFHRTQLPCSIGIATNKLIAKMASTMAKPGGVYQVHPGDEERFLAPLPIQSMPGIGEKTQIKLNDDGIKTIGDLQVMEVDVLIKEYGAWGYHFFLASHGRDNRPVEWEDHAPKSIGAETTFDVDQTDKELLRQSILDLSLRAWQSMQKQKMRTSAITLKLRDQSFRTITRSRQLLSDTNDLNIIQNELIDLFKNSYADNTPLRLVGVSLRKLTDNYWQPTLWDWAKEQLTG
jgi:DNA polymerase IV